MLTDKIIGMNMAEMRYFSMVCKERIHMNSGINPMKVNMNWPSVKNAGMYLLFTIDYFLIRPWNMASQQP